MRMRQAVAVGVGIASIGAIGIGQAVQRDSVANTARPISKYGQHAPCRVELYDNGATDSICYYADAMVDTDPITWPLVRCYDEDRAHGDNAVSKLRSLGHTVTYAYGAWYVDGYVGEDTASEASATTICAAYPVERTDSERRHHA